MRLQGAIFYLPETLVDNGMPRVGADKVLSILKMEGVWMYAVTALSRAEAEELLRRTGSFDCFRGILTEGEALCPLYGAAMLEKAQRRLRSQKADTVVFSSTRAGVEAAKSAGFRAVAVGSAAEEAEWHAMCAMADYELPHFEDWLGSE